MLISAVTVSVSAALQATDALLNGLIFFSSDVLVGLSFSAAISPLLQPVLP